MDQQTRSVVEPLRELRDITEKENRQGRRDRQARELESNQQALRESIAESKRLAEQADAMIRRHRHECDASDGGKEALAPASCGEKPKAAGSPAMRLAPLFLAALAALAGCSPGAEVPAAERAAASFHAQLDSGRFTAIYAQSSDEMKRTTSQPDLVRLLKAVHARLGRFRSGRTAGWNDSRTSVGRFVTLDYAATYEAGAAQENFVFRIDGGRAVLAGYHVDSKALSEPPAQPPDEPPAQRPVQPPAEASVNE